MTVGSTGIPANRTVALRLPPHGWPDGVHSVVRDEAGNSYASDDFNYRVVSWDIGGNIRWQSHGGGPAIMQFNQPAGLALGWISLDREFHRCVAVSYPSSNRVRFLNTEGEHLSWWGAARIPFSAVCDVRYIESEPPHQDGIWLVLDRGNHRIAALDTRGEFLFESGRALPPHLEFRWPKARLQAPWDSLPPGRIRELPVYDPLYYPSRLVGREESALFIDQPGSGRLKQFLLGCLLPISQLSACDGEWIGVTENCFVSWNRRESLISWTNSAGRLIRREHVSGRAICCGTAHGEIWFQDGQDLELRCFSLGFEPDAHHGHPLLPLLHSAETDLSAAAVRIPGGFAGLNAAVADVLTACDQLISLCADNDIQHPSVPQLLDRLAASESHIDSAVNQFGAHDHSLWLAILKTRVAVQCGAKGTVDLHHKIEAALSPLSDAIASLVCRLDQCVLLRIEIQRNEAGGGVDSILGKLEAALFRIVGMMRRCSDSEFSTLEIDLLPARRLPGAIGPGAWIRRPHRRQGRASSASLEETERFVLMDGQSGTPPYPLGIAETSDGSLFVSLFGIGRLLRLNASGSIDDLTTGQLDSLAGPAGIAADRQDRIWIVENRAHRLSILDPAGAMIRRLDLAGKLAEPLYGPVGIACEPEGTALVCDSGNHRIVRIYEDKDAEVICARKGTCQGELTRPAGICLSRLVASAFWVVDQRNHRLQEFAADGRCLRHIGRLGTSRGCLLIPQYVAQFADGVLVVSQNQLDRSLRLFSPEGEEIDRLVVDYRPGGLLVSRQNLFVPELDGRAIRVYRRVV